MRSLGKVMGLCGGIFGGHFFLGNPDVPWLTAILALSALAASVCAFAVKE